MRLRLARLEGRWALAAFVERGVAQDKAPGFPPSYFVLLRVEEGRAVAIRDFRYVPDIVTEADFVLEGP